MQISEVREPAALNLAAAMVRRPVEVPAMGRAIDTAFVGPDSWPTPPAGAQTPDSLLPRDLLCSRWWRKYTSVESCAVKVMRMPRLMYL
jgi:hypothetical protein